MDDSLQLFAARLRSLLRSVWRRRWVAFGTTALAVLATGLVVDRIGERFDASARVYVDTQTVLKPLMAGLTYQPDIDQQVAMLANTLISRAHVDQILHNPVLGPVPADEAAQEARVTRLMGRLRIVPTSSGNLYEIRYRGSSPADARDVVQAVVDLFASAGAGPKQQDAREAGRFIDAQIADYEAKLAEAENRRKDFKLRHFGVTGVSDKDTFLRIASLGEELGKLRIELAAAARSRDAYRRELASEDPQLPLEAARPDSLEGRLAAQRRQLDDLLRRYTDAHPDVIGARRGIAELEAELRRRDTDPGASRRMASAATSPVYQRLRVSLAEAEATVASLQSQVAAGQQRLDDARGLAARLPQAEAEMAQLDRDYDVVRKNYDQMVARREAATLGARLDATAQLADFRVIDPPRANAAPVFPARVHIAWAGFGAALLLGALAAVLADRLQAPFDEPRELRLATRAPGVLEAVGLIDAAPEQRRLEVARFAAALGGLGVVQWAWVAALAGAHRMG